MRVLPLLTGALSQVQERQAYDNGQYTVASTVISYSESYIYSSEWAYGTTTIVTITTYIPCPTWTSYTTLTTWSCPMNCPDTTICYPKSCIESDGGGTFITSTEFGAGDTATAVVTGSGSAFTTFIPGLDCTTTYPFVDTGSSEGLPDCGKPGPGPGPGPVDILCIASPCLVLSITTYSTATVITIFTTKSGHIETISITSDYEVTSTVTSTSTTTQTGNEPALISTNPPQYTDASSCYTFIAPEDGVTATGICGANGGGGDGGGSEGSDTCAASVVAYTYTTSGAEVVETTTLPGRCISFSGGGNRIESVSLGLLVWLCYGAAILSGVGMIVL